MSRGRHAGVGTGRAWHATSWRFASAVLSVLLSLGALAGIGTALAIAVGSDDGVPSTVGADDDAPSTVGVHAAQHTTGRSDVRRMTGIWHGERYGMEVIWRFEPNGRMTLEERAAAWHVAGDTLVVDFEPLGESGPERAVYLYLLSDLEYGPRRMFVHGFDLGTHGVLLTRERDD